MAEPRGAPAVYSIPVHRAFADALVNGLLARHGGDPLTLAKGLIIVPNARAARSINDAFVRRAEGALLLPRIVPIGDVGGDEVPALFDTGVDVPAAIAPLRREMLLARLIAADEAVTGGEALRLAAELARVLDELQAERLSPRALAELDLEDRLAQHWQASLKRLELLWTRWPRVLAAAGRIDLADRRNRLFDAAALRWAEQSPASFVVAAGVTSAAPAIAALLKTIARLPDGAVVLPGLDLGMPEAEWDAIAGEDAPEGNGRPIETHPQYALRLLLDRMNIARGDVKRWRWGDGRPRQSVRARQVSNAFAPARFTDKWNRLPRPQTCLPRVRLAEFATAGDEAQGVAIAIRQALETPGKTVALVTPDRALAGRVVEHLKRWGVDADDSAGRPLSQLPPGTLLRSLALAAVERFPPVQLLSLLKHPLVRSGEGRIAWLEQVRRLDMALRGPRPAPGLGGVRAHVAEHAPALLGWWDEVAALLAPLEALSESESLARSLDLLRGGATAMAGEAVWGGPAGRAAADLLDELGEAAPDAPAVTTGELPDLLARLPDRVAVRPPQGGHPRVAILGLIEARLQSADLVIAGGLNDGIWPAAPAPDPWLAPTVRQALGLGAVDRRVGLAAHDLAGVLGAREVLLTRAKRVMGSPTLESRFLLRLQAMLGEGLQRDEELVSLAEAIDTSAAPVPRAERPAPMPPAALRPRDISVTAVDRLKADPYAFYAQRVLRLRALDEVDAEPGPAWRGSAVHAVLEDWHKADDGDPEKLRLRAAALLAGPAVHPLLRALWRPRLDEALDWIAGQVAKDRGAGRRVLAVEAQGRIELAGVELHGRADRLDRLNDGTLAVVDYKTGQPPSPAAVENGYAMQLGLLGLIAERGGFADIAGTAGTFEYWSLAKANGQFGQRKSPFRKSGGLDPSQFVEASQRQFEDAAGKWLTGEDAFIAKLNPDYANYDDYDQLMRLDEWYGRG